MCFIKLLNEGTAVLTVSLFSFRLYEQLEEVKLRKAVQSRQEAYARNRQKAKAFHMVNHHTHFPFWRHYAYDGALNWRKVCFYSHTENPSEAPCQADSSMSECFQTCVNDVRDFINKAFNLFKHWYAVG